MKKYYIEYRIRLTDQYDDTGVVVYAETVKQAYEKAESMLELKRGIDGYLRGFFRTIKVEEVRELPAPVEEVEEIKELSEGGSSLEDCEERKTINKLVRVVNKLSKKGI